MNEVFKKEWELYTAAGSRPQFRGLEKRVWPKGFDGPVKVGEIRVFADMNRPFVALVRSWVVETLAAEDVAEIAASVASVSSGARSEDATAREYERAFAVSGGNFRGLLANGTAEVRTSTWRRRAGWSIAAMLFLCCGIGGLKCCVIGGWRRSRPMRRGWWRIGPNLQRTLKAISNVRLIALKGPMKPIKNQRLRLRSKSHRSCLKYSGMLYRTVRPFW